MCTLSSLRPQTDAQETPTLRIQPVRSSFWPMSEMSGATNLGSAPGSASSCFLTRSSEDACVSGGALKISVRSWVGSGRAVAILGRGEG